MTTPDDRPCGGLTRFLDALTDLSRRTGIAVGDGAPLYLMEAEDVDRRYCVDRADYLHFGDVPQDGMRSDSPELGPGGRPSAGSTPCADRRSARTAAGSTS